MVKEKEDEKKDKFVIYFDFRKGKTIPEQCFKCGKIMVEGIIYQDRIPMCRDCLDYLERERDIRIKEKKASALLTTDEINWFEDAIRRGDSETVSELLDRWRKRIEKMKVEKKDRRLEELL